MQNTIINHFKISKDFLNRYGKYIRPYSNDFVFKNRKIRLKINDIKLKPEWCEQEIEFPVPGLYNANNINNAKTDNNAVSIFDGNDEISFLNLNEKIEINNFDGIINYLLFERYFKHKRPFFTKFPLPYHLVPVNIRNFLMGMIRNDKTRKDKNDKKLPEFPHYPIEKSVELIRHLFLKSLEIKTDKKVPCAQFWPGSKKCCFIATHDMETESSFKNIGKIREIEKRHCIMSSWNVLSKRYKIGHAEIKMLKGLKNEGCEIGIHGYNHDGKLPYISKEKMKKRILHALKRFEEFGCTSFRSPQLQRSEDFLHELSSYFECDSSVPDTDFMSAFAAKSGCCTVFPFFIGNMAEIPITLDQDFRLIYTHKYNTEQIFNNWKEKADFICQLGGVINILTHPDDYLIGNDKYLSGYEKFLNYMAKKYEDGKVYHDTISHVARWWKERDKINC